MNPCATYQSFGQFLESHSPTEALLCFFQHAPVEPSAMAGSLWMIIFLPLLGAAVCGLLGKLLGRANTALVACMAVFGAFVLSALAFWVTADHGLSWPNPFSNQPTPYAFGADSGTWFSAGNFTARFGLRVDHLSGSMLLIVTGIGFLIHLYSAEYMGQDPGYWRYFAYLNLFIAAMALLVLADSLPLLFIGWEGVGLCSYLLIGFWYSDAAKAWAGRKAFVVNRVGDFGFLLGMLLLVLMVDAFSAQAVADNFAGGQSAAAKFREGLTFRGQLHFQGLEELARALTSRGSGAVGLSTVIAGGPLEGFTFGGVLTAVLLLFMLGAAGKSAQLPLYVWLPDAMAGPTPVSALIHAATMVTAGVYLFCRISHLLVLSPLAMAVIALVGGATALWAALIAFAQDDIKKVLAYSTVSQLGIMFIGVGVGAFWAAFLHLATHAAFKACLFLGAGSVMHGNDDETDIKRLGGLKDDMKVTWATFLVSTFAITGVLPLSGFFSKDAILHLAHTTALAAYPKATQVAWALGLITAGCTAFYMFRLYWLTFEGRRSVRARTPHGHESGLLMTFPLVVLASLAVVMTFTHAIPRRYPNGLRPMMEDFLSPVFRTTQALMRSTGFVRVEREEGLPWGAWLIALVVSWLGAGAAVSLYARLFPSRAGEVPRWAATVRKLVANKFYVDEAYDFLVVRPIKAASFILYKVVDSLLIDTFAVRGTAFLTARMGALLRYLQTGDAQSYAAAIALALAAAVVYAMLKVAS